MAAITETPAATLPRAYPDLHDHVDALRKAGLLIVVDRPINKDTEMHPLVRWQFRGGIREEDRRAFLFTNVTDGKGLAYDVPVLVCGLAGNRAIYSLGMQCAIDEIRDTWIRAMTHPIAPRLVEDAPCHEIVYTGAALTSGHGLDDIPCRSRRRAGTTPRTPARATSSPRTRRPASRTWATIAASSRRRTGSA